MKQFASSQFFTLLAERIGEADIDDCVKLLKEMAHAEFTVRAPLSMIPVAEQTQADKRRGYGYIHVPDNDARVNAIKLILTYKCVPPPSLHEIHVLNSDTARAQLTPAEAILELARQGADVDALLGPWIEAMKKAEVVPIAPGPLALGPAAPIEPDVAPEPDPAAVGS